MVRGPFDPAECRPPELPPTVATTRLPSCEKQRPDSDGLVAEQVPKHAAHGDPGNIPRRTVLCLHERMVFSRQKQQDVLAGLKAHHEIVTNAEPRVDSYMSAACVRNVRTRQRIAQRVCSEHAKHPTEPLTLFQNMSFHTLREWRLNLNAHRRRVHTAQTMIDDSIAEHVKSYKRTRGRRLAEAKRPLSQGPRGESRRKYNDLHSVIMNAWQPSEMTVPAADQEGCGDFTRRPKSHCWYDTSTPRDGFNVFGDEHALCDTTSSEHLYDRARPRSSHPVRQRAPLLYSQPTDDDEAEGVVFFT